MDEFWLRKALELAHLNLGNCAPNPAVGAVAVKDGKLIGEGFHRGPGTAHAEVMALEKTSVPSKGATIYVSLEPCCHWGRTPPCTDLIIQKKIKRVVYGYADPNPVVHGKGESALRQAGIQCDHLALPEVDEFYRPYQLWTKEKRPWITAKLALSLDGRYGLPDKRLHLTSELANRFTHEQRLHHDALLTTAATVIADDPRLDARIEGTLTPKSLFIIDPNGDTPPTARVFDCHSKITLLTQSTAPNNDLKLEALENRGAKIVKLEPDDARLSWPTIWETIGKEGHHSVWVEAGGRTFADLMLQRQLNRAYLFISPLWVGSEGHRLFEQSNFRLSDLGATVRWREQGADVLCEILW